MSGAFAIGAIGLETQQRALDAIANNIANLNTDGFKRSDVRFADVVASRAEPTTIAADLSHEPDRLAGVLLDTRFRLDDQGALERTGRALDLAIDGPGLIELMGPDGRALLWRGGTLRVNPDGLLASEGGLALRAAIAVPQDASALTIAADGTVAATLPDSAEPVELGRIALVRVTNATMIERLDGGFYRLDESDGEPAVEVVPGEDGAGTLVQGSIERSNVALTDEMVRMMLVQRAYAANAQMVQAADQMMAIANGLRR